MDALNGHGVASNEREGGLESATAFLEDQDGRRKRHEEQDLLTVLRKWQASDVEQQELNRAQQELNRAHRERLLQMALDDVTRARELEAALRREENAGTAAFNQAFLGTLSQLVHALSGRCDPDPLPPD